MNGVVVGLKVNAVVTTYLGSLLETGNSLNVARTISGPAENVSVTSRILHYQDTSSFSKTENLR